MVGVVDIVTGCRPDIVPEKVELLVVPVEETTVLDIV